MCLVDVTRDGPRVNNLSSLLLNRSQRNKLGRRIDG